MIAFLIENIDVRGGTHKQFLKLLDYASSQNEPFFIVTRRVDLDKTYPGFSQYKDRIRILEDEPKGSRSILAQYYRRYKMRRKLARLISDADIVNVHDNGFEELLPAFKGKRTVWQINDLYYAFRVGVCNDFKDSRHLRRLRNIVLKSLKNVDEITVNVSKNAARVRDKLNRNAKVLYCGIEPIGISHDAAESFRRFENRRINLLSSGVWFPYRNYETQVEVVRLLSEQDYDVRLKIIGSTQYDEAYLEKILAMISDYGLTDRIEICGMIDEDRFRELHSESDIFMFINVDQSWGLAVFEAMSCGLPVIVSNSVGATEILNDGVDSLFVDPRSPEEIAEVIKNLINDRKVYEMIAGNAKVFHKKYTWDDAYSSKMLNLLKK